MHTNTDKYHIMVFSYLYVYALVLVKEEMIMSLCIHRNTSNFISSKVKVLNFVFMVGKKNVKIFTTRNFPELH